MNFLITSGGTREYIDPVRFISNASTGKIGFALASAALRAGHKVTLITTVKKSNIKNQISKLRIVTVQTAAQMFEAVKKHFPHCDCLVMAAAVADYTPIRPAKTKIKKQDKVLTLKLKPTVDILKWAGRHKKLKIKDQTRPEPGRGKSKMRKGKRLVVGFALEDRNLRANAERKMREKNLDMIIVNTPESIGADKTSAQIKMPGQKWLKIAKAGKTAVAEKVIILMEAIQERSDSCLAGKAQMR